MRRFRGVAARTQPRPVRRRYVNATEYAAYMADVKRSALARPRDAVPVASADAAAVAPFLDGVDPLSARLSLVASRGRGDSSIAASALEATWPLSSDESLRRSVSCVDTGQYSTFRLGKFYEAVDALTADVAYAHAGAAPGGDISLVTASHAHSRKHNATIVDEDATLRCYVVRAGSASLELRTDGLQVRNGVEVLLNTCATTMVAVDAAGRPVKGAIPPLAPPDAEDADRAAVRARLAATHATLRKGRDASTMRLRTTSESLPPQPHEMAALHERHRTRHDLRNAGEVVWTVGDATYQSSVVVYPEQRNSQGTLFGGFVAGQAYTLAVYAAKFFGSGGIVPLGLDYGEFFTPISIGDCVSFTARVVHATRYTCRVNVSVEVRDPENPRATPWKANRLVFVFATRCPENGVLPETYSEIISHMDAARASAIEGPTDDEAVLLLPFR